MRLSLLVLAVLAAGCGAPQKADSTPTPTPTPTPGMWPDPSCFTGGQVPQLDLTGPQTNWTWNDPSVLKVGSEYWMYASATDYFTFPVRLYRLVSTDGATWTLNPTTPILADAAPGQWDSGGTETPSVAFFGGLYHLFYTGYPVAPGQPTHSALDYRFGHATSVDGINFTRASSTPVVEPSGTDSDPTNDWDEYVAAEPGAVVFNGKLSVYFTTIGVDQGVQSTLQVVGLVTTTNGTDFSAPTLALKPDQTLYPRAQDWIGYSTPSAIVIDNAVHLFVDVAKQPSGGAWHQLRIQHASSADGVSNWTQDPAPIASAPFNGWAVSDINGPAALLDGTTLRLWFAGQELDGVAPDHFAIGMMSCAQ